MIAVDANVFLRYALWDIPEQAEAAARLLEGLTPENPGFMCREVAMEVAWVLDRVYGFTRAEVLDAMLRLTTAANLMTENGEDVLNAAIAHGRGGSDFADLMLLAAARRAGAAPLYTFDQRLAREDGAALLGA